MALGAGTNKPLDIEIVGLVRDAKYDEVREPAPPQFVMPYRQADIGALTFYVRPAPPHRRCSLRSLPSSADWTPTSRSAIFGRWRIRFDTTRAAIVR
jgi:hypothetical protein